MISELDAPEELEVLYWVGCAAALDDRLQSVARAMVRVMNRAGVRFAVLGSEERCTGDPARRTGNEFHFQLVARENIEALRKYGVRRIVTHCPHCLQTLGRDYRDLGGDFEVIHHTAFVRSLIEEGRLDVPAGLGECLTYHDPCYLGRYAGEYEAPRVVLDALGSKPVEMPRSRENSFCCGAGGGHAFFEDDEGGKVNVNRAREAVGTGASTICTACPFCLSMLEEGVAATKPDEPPRVRDFVELVEEALGGPETGG
ncbi:MAG: (Fe-S)-binding protein [Gemmatimonadetes bacterium]|nr:(Fe-S)-binding protein [Gemmatimonadota bacterium]NIR79166.1 (Fe-S)-binding protein [Gemmatimonadota bacterium]NIT87821.1 (Fe-S)-binding protein [Gemmatimonadota bacterium]NIU31682.1 (Fe-S)-binding protein [Gemmatimonadota bacterium]NIU36301.1 (Fe-S)-binding protein [Gemmatimonadota bacterium]